MACCFAARTDGLRDMLGGGRFRGRVTLKDILRAVLGALGAVMLAGCGTAGQGGLSTPGIPIAGSAEPAAAPPTAPIPILYPPHDPAATYPVIRTWTEVVGYEPYPYAVELPAPESTAIDGIYAKLD